MSRVYFATNRNFVGNPDAPFGAKPAAGDPPPIRTGYGEVLKKYPNLGDECYDVEGTIHVNPPITVQPGEPLPEFPIAADLQATAPSSTRHVILFIHGFANPFRTCFNRAAELRDNYLPWVSATAPNQPLLFVFSWPSDGYVLPAEESYMSDRKDSWASGGALASSLRTLIEALTALAPGISLRIHLVAHSMGNRALNAALEKLKTIFAPPLPVIFENTFLMAADEDADALEPGKAMRLICDLSRQVYIYHSQNDLALHISQTQMHNPTRLGWKGPANFSKVPDNVWRVDCSDVSDTPSIVHAWHQYYRQRQEVYEDVAQILAGKAFDDIPNRIAVGPRTAKLIRRFYLHPDPGGVGEV